jgi:endonuclease/exonuclease/phosphatase family metal-dependent hydrolase
MKKHFLPVIVFGVLIFFFIQMAGTLVESIYILDLMHTSLDAKVLGVLFFFAPILLIPFRNKTPNLLVWIAFGLLFLARGITPYLNTSGRMLSSGIGTGAALILFALLITARPKGESASQPGIRIAGGLGLAVSLSILLRTVNYSIDYSLTHSGSWAGWILGALLGFLLTGLDWAGEPSAQNKKGGMKGDVLGIFLLLTLVYFAFSAPAVIARWTEGSYSGIVLTVSLLAAAGAWLSHARPRYFERISPLGLALWNLAFTLSLTSTILAHRVAFPQTPESAAVVVGAPTWWQQIPLVLMLVLFPVIFFDMRLFVSRIEQRNPSPRDWVPGMLLGGLALVLLVFINIFTNVWGYVPPVSTIFRNIFWLPYLLITGIVTLLALFGSEVRSNVEKTDGKISWGWAVLLAMIFLATAAGALHTSPHPSALADRSSLVVMTYNIQAANDASAEHAYDRQLALIQQVSPDILSLQETDTARISLNNNDYVRYYAGKLGYYSYYGPATVTGTFGTAILSKYPLLNTRTSFTYSDQDEAGTAEAEIEVSGRTFTFYDVHPDGSDSAKMAFAESLLERSQEKPYVIALGDYNLRDNEAAFQLIASVYTNAWASVYPSLISPDGTDMSGRNRIDHIFLSPSLTARNAVYVLPPTSATDHPVHWAEIFWGK